MLAKRRNSCTRWLAMLLAVLFITAPGPAMAQFFNDDFTRDDFVESDEDFSEGSGEIVSPTQEDFTDGGQFIDEEEAVRRESAGGVTITTRRDQLRLESDRVDMPLNVGWGAVTGLLMGGWFALISNGDDRSTQRSIGSGIVLGALLGMTVGLKSVIAPNAPRAAMQNPERNEAGIRPSLTVSLDPELPPLRVGFVLRF
ncbi:MAG: hypothetical protein O7A69_15475 [SAR324 cluster bacterium]|nr:hypothetical protein [SAR324 cluster bacterium]MCZ6559152.1 hypothetical protein [SAR324 cluster bacterium]